MEAIAPYVTHDTNFIRIFQLPSQFSGEFCFSGGIPHLFLMVDWFNPIPMDDFPGRLKPWDEYVPMLKEFIGRKPYIRPGRKYIGVTDFGGVLFIDGPPD